MVCKTKTIFVLVVEDHFLRQTILAKFPEAGIVSVESNVTLTKYELTSVLRVHVPLLPLVVKTLTTCAGIWAI